MDDVAPFQRSVNISLTEPQYKFVTSDATFPALVAGFGSGKTHALIMRAISRKLAYPKNNFAYYLPTFDLVRTIAFPRFLEVLEEMKIRSVLNKTYATLELEDRGSFIFRTMDNPERIVGYEVADSGVDELDTLDEDKARNVWNKIIARNRQKKADGSRNTVAVGTTPEGFRFVYDRWVRQKKKDDGYEIIKASTWSNAANLPEGYIENLQKTYPENLLSAYLDGEFVNLAFGRVYPEFDRTKNSVFSVLGAATIIQPSEPLHIGMDFNVGNMSATVNVIRRDVPYCLDEIMKVADTPAMIREIKERYKGHAIFVYPDSSGKSRQTNNASTSDIAMLRQAGFTVIVDTQNPAVRDRILSMNNAICSKVNGKEIRRFFINPDKCPALTEALEKQAYDKNGLPSKSTGLDHPADAQGYFITQKWPVRPLGMRRLELVGI